VGTLAKSDTWCVSMTVIGDLASPDKASEVVGTVSGFACGPSQGQQVLRTVAVVFAFVFEKPQIREQIRNQLRAIHLGVESVILILPRFPACDERRDGVPSHGAASEESGVTGVMVLKLANGEYRRFHR
jgi:hypothetical protein